MKKILTILALFFTLKGASQFPVNSTAGTPTTTVLTRGVAAADSASRLMAHYADTTAINRGRLDEVPGATVRTTDGKIWVRDTTASFWILMGGGSSPGGLFWLVGVNEFPTVPASGISIGTGAANGGSFTIKTSGVARAVFPTGGPAVTTDTSANKILTLNTSTKDVGYTYWNNASVLPSGWALQVDHDETKASNLWVQGAYEVGRLYKNCFYEFWVKPGDSCEYIISTGYGGAHLILFGFSGGTTGKLTLTGNMWHAGANIASLLGQDTVTTNTVHLIAVAYDGTWITTFIDGVPSKRVAYTGYRSIQSTPADVDLFIFGSDHSKFKGYGFKFRGFETGTVAPPVSTTVPYAPKQVWQSSSGAYFQYDVTAVKESIANDGQGDGGLKFTAARNSGANYNEFQAGGSINPAYLPQWVQMPMTQSAYSGTIPTPAGSPKVYDHFSRLDRVPAWENTPALGNTEGGSAGVKTWALNGGGYAGIINNAAYFSAATFAWVASSSATDSIIVIRGVGSEEDISVIARRQDSDDYLEFYVSGGYGYLRQYVAGTPTAKGDFAMPGGWTTVTLVVSGNFAQLYTGVTKQINNADISTGATTAVGVGFGAYNSFVRISSFICY